MSSTFHGREPGLAEPGWEEAATEPTRGGSLARTEVAVRRSDAGVYDGLRLYLHEIGRVGLLDAAEEMALASRAWAGDVDARQRLVEGNLRLVVSVARAYAGWDVPLLDLIAEGNGGLLRAAERFDPSFGCRFSTYAIYWVRQAIFRALAEQSRVVRVPVHLLEALRELGRVRHRFLLEHGREPTAEEVAEELRRPLNRVQALLRAGAPAVSLQARPSDDDGLSVGDRLADTAAPDPAVQAAQGLVRERIHEVLAGLGERERLILEWRFGLHDGVPRSRAEIGRHLGVTREAVRQTEVRALRKLRHPARLRELSDPQFPAEA